MTDDRPLEVTEMAVRVVIQTVWFGCLATALTWWSWESILWAFNGFPAIDPPDSITILLHGVATLVAAAWTLRAGGLLLFQLLPFLIAKALQPRPPTLKRGD